MSASTCRGPALIFVVSDGIRGHLSQSRGVAGWLSRFTGSEILELAVPLFSGARKAWLLKWKAKRMAVFSREESARWLRETGAVLLLDGVREKMSARALNGNDVIFISAGSGAAPFCLALAKASGGRSCTIMTPSALGTSPFDFAVVPAHDCPAAGDGNLLVTLGAPNGIFPDELERLGWELRDSYPPVRGHELRWGILIGGDDGNYRISPAWARDVLLPLLHAAECEGADVYVTTSRRTAPETESALEALASGSQSVRMLLLASKDPWNPVPGMIGLCSRLFVTEDSVSMVSEAVTAGKDVVLLRVGKRGRIRAFLQEATAWGVEKKLLPRGLLWGIPRFDRLFLELEERGLLRELGSDHGTGTRQDLPGTGEGMPRLNEARRAACWILEKWTPGDAGGAHGANLSRGERT